jgi:hypothetical protein
MHPETALLRLKIRALGKASWCGAGTARRLGLNGKGARADEGLPV